VHRKTLGLCKTVIIPFIFYVAKQPCLSHQQCLSNSSHQSKFQKYFSSFKHLSLCVKANTRFLLSQSKYEYKYLIISIFFILYHLFCTNRVLISPEPDQEGNKLQACPNLHERWTQPAHVRCPVAQLLI
jgi:hypothetical protein